LSDEGPAALDDEEEDAEEEARERLEDAEPWEVCLDATTAPAAAAAPPPLEPPAPPWSLAAKRDEYF